MYNYSYFVKELSVSRKTNKATMKIYVASRHRVVDMLGSEFHLLLRLCILHVACIRDCRGGKPLKLAARDIQEGAERRRYNQALARLLLFAAHACIELPIHPIEQISFLPPGRNIDFRYWQGFFGS
jgi:hypothetical protein